MQQSVAGGQSMGWEWGTCPPPSFCRRLGENQIEQAAAPNSELPKPSSVASETSGSAEYPKPLVQRAVQYSQARWLPEMTSCFLYFHLSKHWISSKLLEIQPLEILLLCFSSKKLYLWFHSPSFLPDTLATKHITFQSPVLPPKNKTVHLILLQASDFCCGMPPSCSSRSPRLVGPSLLSHNCLWTSCFQLGQWWFYLTCFGIAALFLFWFVLI